MDNGMDPLHLTTGLVMGQNGVSINHLTKAERIQDEDYNNWSGYSKIGFSPIRGQRDGEIRKEEATETEASAGVYGKLSAMFDCDGSLWRS